LRRNLRPGDQQIAKARNLELGISNTLPLYRSALQAYGVRAWWFHAQRYLAQQAFVARGGIDPVYFDRQMNDIDREWLLIASVFGSHVVEGLHLDGSQRTPEELWREIAGRDDV
jgi:hypothetical protein